MDGRPGRARLYTLRGEAGATLYERCVLVVVGHRTYKVNVDAADASALSRPEVTAFFASFHVDSP